MYNTYIRTLYRNQRAVVKNKKEHTCFHLNVKPFLCLIYIDNRKQPIIYTFCLIFHILATTLNAVHEVEMTKQISDWENYDSVGDNSNLIKIMSLIGELYL